MIEQLNRWPVLVPFPLHPEGIRCLGAVEVRVSDHEITTEEELAPLLDHAAGLIIGSTPVGAATLAQARHLMVIGRHGVGLDNIDLAAATRYGIVVTYVPDVLTASVAEHTIGLMIALARLLPTADALVRSGSWRDALPRLGTELAGKTLGLVGLGRVGALVAQMARSAFQMRVLAVDPQVQTRAARALGVEVLDDLHTLLPQIDVLSLHVPLTPQTHHLIGTSALARVRQSAYLINTARGGLVDTAALVVALRERRLAGAALDTFEAEPLPSTDELIGLDNVILTPHIASHTNEAISRLAVTCAVQVLDVLAGRRPAHLANPEVWEHRRTTLAGP